MRPAPTVMPSPGLSPRAWTSRARWTRRSLCEREIAYALSAEKAEVERRIDAGKGFLKFLLEGTIERLGVLGAFAFALGSAKGGSSLQRFYGDEFESITGTFRVGDGRARSRDLRLLYRHYQVDLDGSLGLVDSSLDFKGLLTIPFEFAMIAVWVGLSTPRRSELEQKIDERLGEGSGREVIDALEGLLGGRKRP